MTPTRTLSKREQNKNTFQLFLSLARHSAKWAFFKFLHVAPRSCCHAAAGMWKQPERSNDTKLQHRKQPMTSAGAASSPKSTEKRRIKWFKVAGLKPKGHSVSMSSWKVSRVRLPVSTETQWLPKEATTALGTWQQRVIDPKHTLP